MVQRGDQRSESQEVVSTAPRLRMGSKRQYNPTSCAICGEDRARGIDWLLPMVTGVVTDRQSGQVCRNMARLLGHGKVFPPGLGCHNEMD